MIKDRSVARKNAGEDIEAAKEKSSKSQKKNPNCDFPQALFLHIPANYIVIIGLCHNILA